MITWAVALSDARIQMTVLNRGLAARGDDDADHDRRAMQASKEHSGHVTGDEYQTRAITLLMEVCQVSASESFKWGVAWEYLRIY